MRAIAASAVVWIARQFTSLRGPEMAPDRDVFGDGEIGEQRQVLIDHLNAAGGRLHRIEMRVFATLDHDAPFRLGPKHAGDNLDEGGFAGPVFADEAVDLARRQGEIDVAQRDDAAEPFGDCVEVEEVDQVHEPMAMPAR